MNKTGVNNDPLLSSIHILPETEALLRTIFRTLDVEDSGYVSVSLLLLCLGGTGLGGKNNTGMCIYVYLYMYIHVYISLYMYVYIYVYMRRYVRYFVH
jgi:hypothetical protein